MFGRRREPPPAAPPQPTRTFLTLTNTEGRTVDLWGLARRIEGRIRDLGGPESLPARPPQQRLANPARYTWGWLGDYREVIALAAEVVIEEQQLDVGISIALDGVPAAPPPPPQEPEHAPEPEPDPVTAFEQARAEFHAAASRPIRVRVRQPGER